MVAGVIVLGRDPARAGADLASWVQTRSMRYVELRRHTDNDGDQLTERGRSDAEAIGRHLRPPYAAFVSTGAQRCTTMLEILRVVFTEAMVWSGSILATAVRIPFT